jgi:DNA-binding response OmpR family regulator
MKSAVDRSHVVVAMQDQSVCSWLARHLRSDGHQVREVTTVDDMIELLCQSQVDLVVSDSVLGPSLARWRTFLANTKTIRLRSSKEDKKGGATIVFDRPWDIDSIRAAANHLIWNE